MSSCVAWKIRRAARVLTRVYDDALAPVGLTSGQLGALDALAESGPATLTRLAEINGHERSVAWRGLQPLIRRGLVSHIATTRPARFEITEAGSALLSPALERWRGVQDRIVALLGDELGHLNAMIDKLDTLDRTAATPTGT